MSALAKVSFYLILPQQNPPFGFWFTTNKFYLKMGQNPNTDPGKLSVINKKPRLSNITSPSQFLAISLSSNCKYVGG